MKKLEEIAFIVQARLNSERVPRKMALPIAPNDLTLTDLVLQKLTTCNEIPNNQIFVSIAEQELFDIASKYPVNVYKRSYQSANVDNGIQNMFEWWDKLPSQYKYVVMVSGCNPFLSTQTIGNFVKAYLNSENDGMFSVCEKKNYFWNREGEMLNEWPEGQDLLNTKAVDATYEAAHCLYGSRLDSIGEGKWVGSWQKKNDPELFTVGELEAFDIDYKWQFIIAGQILHLDGSEYNILFNTPIL